MNLVAEYRLMFLDLKYPPSSFLKINDFKNQISNEINCMLSKKLVTFILFFKPSNGGGVAALSRVTRYVTNSN